jgi:hypothetical protein
LTFSCLLRRGCSEKVIIRIRASHYTFLYT